MERWIAFAFVCHRYCWQQRRTVEGDVIAFMFYKVHCDDRGAQTGGGMQDQFQTIVITEKHMKSA